ncbi:hypothetical protein [Halorubrum sp. Ib24]|uniref:hypothetical protein n=1 Tax=Halorubrum sp. Ib24 TaxID=1383850 RepID=UPI00117B38D7|nr:hypothetical protein [Halorubrum sp. Ib24]
MKRTSDTPTYEKRYDSLCDASGEWKFEIREYQNDLNSIVPSDIPPDPNPQEAYRAAVFLEGFIEEQKATVNWSDTALDEFESFGSTLEVEAVAKALREISEEIET